MSVRGGVLAAMAFVSFLAATASAQDPAPATSRPALDPSLPTLFIIGDSTVRNGGKDQVGWGDPIKELFDRTKINVENRAIGGRSSRTFRTEGRWQRVLDDAKPGDFVLMQFGHNDPAKLAGDNRERGTIRGIGDETEEVTLTLKNGQKETVHTFGWYMRQYVAEAKAKGMTPIVCSYVPRSPRPDEKDPQKFATSKPTVPTEPTSYALWAKQSAEAERAAFIDLFKLVTERYAQYTGAQIKQRFFTTEPNDYTHTNAAGAKLAAECVVEGLRQLPGQPLVQYLKPQQ